MARPGRKPLITLDAGPNRNAEARENYHQLKPDQVNLQIRKVDKQALETFAAIRDKLGKGNPETFGEIVRLAAQHLGIDCKQPVKQSGPSLSILCP